MTCWAWLSGSPTKLLPNRDWTRPLEGRIEVCASLKRRCGTGRGLGRYRFTVAHEVGHWVLHRPLYLRRDESLDLFGAQTAENRLVSLRRDVFSRRSAIPREEWQANRFAAYLLIPTVDLREEFIRRFGEPPQAAECFRQPNDTARTLARRLARESNPENPTPLCDAFGVSVEAMAIALESRRYVPDAPTLL